MATGGSTCASTGALLAGSLLDGRFTSMSRLRIYKGNAIGNAAALPQTLKQMILEPNVALLCRLLHHTHHKYNKEHTLSPFAGLAFNPLDGILQVISIFATNLKSSCFQHEVFLVGASFRQSCMKHQGNLTVFSHVQAIPYCWTLMYIPMHFLTHELLLFATGVWTTNIHDCIHGR